jgi:hypothetical protein
VTHSSDPLRFAEQPDPVDLVNFGIDVGFLLTGTEAVDPATIAITPSTDAAALGISVGVDTGRAPGLAPDGHTIVFWPEVDPAFQTNPAFDGFGVEAEFFVRFATNHNPPHRFERTAVVQFRRR